MNLQISRENYHWTDHVRQKMRQYGLSESRIKRILRYPKRVEVGVAEDTVAGMQPAGSKKHPFEIWVMWTQKGKSDAKRRPESRIQNRRFLGRDKLREGSRSATAIHGIASPRFSGVRNDQIVIISAWRYPGVSPRREPPPIPDDVWEALRKVKKS